MAGLDAGRRVDPLDRRQAARVRGEQRGDRGGDLALGVDVLGQDGGNRGDTRHPGIVPRDRTSGTRPGRRAEPSPRPATMTRRCGGEQGGRGTGGSRVVDLALACHPAPTVAVTVFAVAMAAGADAPVATTALVGAAVLAGQLSVGWSNDWIDADRDAAVGRTDKPVGAGRLAVRTVRTAALSRGGGVRGALAGARLARRVSCTWRPWRRPGPTTSGSRAPSGRGRRTRSRSASCRWPSRWRCPARRSPPGGRWRRVPCSGSVRTGRTWCRTSRTTGPPGSGAFRTGSGGTATSIGTALALVAATVLVVLAPPGPPRAAAAAALVLAVGLTIVGTVLALGGGRHRLPFRSRSRSRRSTWCCWSCPTGWSDRLTSSALEAAG